MDILVEYIYIYIYIIHRLHWYFLIAFAKPPVTNSWDKPTFTIWAADITLIHSFVLDAYQVANRYHAPGWGLTAKVVQNQGRREVRSHESGDFDDSADTKALADKGVKIAADAMPV